MNQLHRRSILIGAASTAFAGVADARPRLNQVAPPFTVITFDDRSISLDDLRGQVVVLNYWATWCGPCRVELPVLASYFRRHAGKGLCIFAVKDASDHRPNNDLTPLLKTVPFLAKRLKGLGYGSIDGAVPTNYVIDRSGILRYARAGAFEFDSLDAVVTPLLDEPAPPAAT